MTWLAVFVYAGSECVCLLAFQVQERRPLKSWLSLVKGVSQRGLVSAAAPRANPIRQGW